MSHRKVPAIGIAVSASPLKFAYRPEIDGLRALAVVPVILFHAGFSWFRGGYVGVDVFFVISGFLITSIIAAGQETGTFSIIGFYERRARRILPALFLVMFCSVPFAWMWLPQKQLGEFADSLVAVTLFCSNFLFWNESGYFATAAAEKPLLHTWSLAIEEQFYLVFPLILSWVWRFGRRPILMGVCVAALASLGLSALAFGSDSDANFYLIPSRAWELLAGSALALVEREQPLAGRFRPAFAQALSVLGLLAIALPVFALDQTTPYPGLPTLLPVCGAWLLLAFAVPGTIAGRILSHRWLAGLGLVSYSAYLWHQPLFAFARLRSFDSLSTPLTVGLCFAVAGLAGLSWYWIERPFRSRLLFTRRHILGGSVSAGLAIIAIGLMGGITGIGLSRFTAAELAVIEPAHSTDANCNWQPLLAAFPKIEICRIGAQGSVNAVVLWGDSHAGALLGALNDSLNERNIPGMMIRNRHCRQIPGIYNRGKTSSGAVASCENSMAALRDQLRQMKPRAFIIALRWTFLLYPVKGRIEQLAFDNGEGGVEQETYREYVAVNEEGNYVTDGEGKSNAIKNFIGFFSKFDVPVFLQYPVPEVGWNVSNLNFKYMISSREIPKSISTSAQKYRDRQKFVLEILDSFASDKNIVAIKPEILLCNTILIDRCAAQIDGVPLYVDDDHLSTAGSRMIMSEIFRHFN